MAGYDGRGARFNIVAVEGNDLSFTVTAVDDAAAAIDLSAATIAASIYNGAGTVIDTLTDAVSGAGSNIITLSLTDTEVDALTEPKSWALVVTRGGDARTWLAGSFTVADPPRARGGGTNGTAITATVDTDVTVTVAAVAGAEAANVNITDTAGNYTATTVEGALAELPGQYAPEVTVADEFGGYANGERTTARLGGAYLNFGGSVGVTAEPQVVDGKLTTPIATPAAASYAQVNHGTPVTRVGARFVYESGSSTDAGAVVLIAWDADYSTTTPTVPDAPCHLVITPINAIFGVWSGGSFTQVDDWTFDTPLAEDGATVHTAEVWIDTANSTCYIHLPDGTLRTVTHATIGAITNANYSCWEIFRNATTDALAGFTEIWSGDELLAGLAATKWAAAQPFGTPVAVTYAPGSADSVTVPSSFADIDATNLKLDVVAPASGKVLIELYGVLDMVASTRVFWGVRSGATSYGTVNVVSQQYDGAISYKRLITGLTPGDSYSFVWQHFDLSGSAATFMLDSPNGYEATMVATPIH